MPLTTTPDMFWSSLGTTKWAAAVAARKAKWVSVRRYMVDRFVRNILSSELERMLPGVWVPAVLYVLVFDSRYAGILKPRRLVA
jgi:hypothetical protein